MQIIIAEMFVNGFMNKNVEKCQKRISVEINNLKNIFTPNDMW